MTAVRVAVLGHTAELGGAEVALLRLIQALDSGWQVTVILFSHGELEQRLRDQGVQVKVLPLAPRTARQGRWELTDPRVLLRSVLDARGFSKQLASLLTEIQAQLVVANTLKAAVVGAAAARRVRLPWVWHLHDRLGADYLPSAVLPLLRLLARGARQVVANSAETARLTRLPPEKVRVAYPGLPEAAFATEHHPPSRPVFGLLGRISSTKGQREFIQAAAQLIQERPETEFLIIGEALFNDQHYAERVRAMPSQLGLADQISFTGWAAEPSAALDQLTALVHASPVPEPFGQVIVEAMARRVPVIATVGGGAAEILTESTSSVTVPPGEALRTPLGQLVAPADPAGMASAMSWVLAHEQEASAQAVRAAESAQRRFTAAASAQVCTAAWRQALARR